MIVRFKVNNFLSYNEDQSITLIPGKSRDHHEHIVNKVRARDADILKSALIYGANASGKSNFVKAMYFMQNMVTRGNSRSNKISYKKFELDISSNTRLSSLEMEFRFNDEYYGYGYEFDQEMIHSEWLYNFNKEKTSYIFKRETKMDGSVNVDLSINKLKKSDLTRLRFIGQDTLPTELFLYSVNQRNIANIVGLEHITNPFFWFRDSLSVIFPGSEFIGLEAEGSKKLNEIVSYFLREFDTGIQELKTVEVDFFSPSVKIPEEVKKQIASEMNTDSRAIIRDEDQIRYAIDKTEDDKIVAQKITAGHAIKGNTELKYFEMYEESDGTQRMIDLIPSLAELISDNQVFVIDEIDRSLHPKLSYKFFQVFFELTKGSMSQVVATTHEDHLLDFDLFRKDEFWFVNKNSVGESELQSLDTYKIRKDLDIKSSYMSGKFNGIPRLSSKLNELLN